MALRKQFGNRLQRLRHVDGMTQQDLAEAASVTVEYISKLERGLASPSFDVLARLCSALRTQPANLFLFALEEAPGTAGFSHGRCDALGAMGLDGFISCIGSWSRDIGSRELHCSSSLGRLLGYPPDEIVSDVDTLLTHFDDADAQRLMAGIRLHDKGLPAPPMRLRPRRRDGSLRQCIAISELCPMAEDKPAKGQAVLLDVTELLELDRHLGRTRNMLEERVRERTEHLHAIIRNLGDEIALRKRVIKELNIFRQMVENSSDRMAFMDKQLTIRVANEATAAFYGLNAQDIIGLSLESLLGPLIADESFKAVLDRVLAGEAMRYQAWQHPQGREPSYQDVALAPCRNDNGAVIGVTGSVRDLTNQQLAKQAAEKAGLNKSAFLAAVCHELRGPLSGVLGMLQVLECSQLNQDQSECVNAALASGRTLEAIMNDILELSRMGAEEFEITAVPSSPRAIAEEALATVSARAAAKGLRLEQHMAARVPGHVLTDPARLRQIMVNLLENAIKHTPGGHVRLDMDMAGDAEAPMLTVAVSDTGPGIPEQLPRRVFKPFSQGEGHAVHPPGTCPGLSLVQRLASLMGGSAKISSTPGKGTTVAVTVSAPAAPGPREQAPSSAAPDAHEDPNRA